MVDFFKSFQSKLDEKLLTVILLILVGIYLANVFPYVSAGVFVRDLLVRGIVAFVVVVMVLKKDFLVAHIVLFLMGFHAAGANFVNGILSYNVDAGRFMWTFDAWWGLNAAVFFYFLLYFVSLFFTKPSLKLQYEKNWAWCLLLMVFAFFLFRGSFNAALTTLLPASVLLLRKEWFYGPLLMVTTLIALPLDFLRHAWNDNLGWRNLSYFFFVALSVVLLVFLAIHLIKLFKADGWRWQEVKAPEKKETPKETETKKESSTSSE